MTPMPVALYQLGCSYQDDYIVVMGGLNELYQPVDTMYVYNIATGNWSLSPTTLSQALYGFPVGTV